MSKVKLSKWIPDLTAEWCYMRIIDGSNPYDYANRIAFIEKTPRIRIAPYSGDICTDSKNWIQGPKGDDSEYGLYEPSRKWCDEQLIKMGYELG